MEIRRSAGVLIAEIKSEYLFVLGFVAQKYRKKVVAFVAVLLL